MQFNDNSITNILSSGQRYPISTPVYYCEKCHSFFDGFTAHEPRMVELTPKYVEQVGCDKWFDPDVMERLRLFREQRDSRY